MKTLIEINDAQIMANPKPVLQDMAKRCDKLLRTLDNVDRALSNDVVFDCWDAIVDKDKIPRHIDIQGEALIRCDKALDGLRKYRDL